MSMIEIEYDFAIRGEVTSLFKDASEWHTLRTLQQHPDRTEDFSGSQIDLLKHNFLVGYASKYSGMAGIDQVECVILKVREDLLDSIKAEVGYQMSRLNRLRRGCGECTESHDIITYEKKIGRRFMARDAQETNLVSFSIETLPVEGDEEHAYMAIFIHPQLRGVMASHLLQEEKRALY